MILVSTITRGAAHGAPSSRLYTVPLDGSRPIGALCVPEAICRANDPNPRGGMRGARGIAVGVGEFFVANYDTVYRYDASWQVAGAITHSDCADIHEIALHDGRLWAVSTRNDRLFQFDLDGRVIETLDPWASGAIEDAFGVRSPSRRDGADLRDPRTHDKSETDGLHLNSLAFAGNGDLLVSLGQVRVNRHNESAIVRFGASGGEEIVHRGAAAPVPAHNVVPLSDGSFLHCDTANGLVLCIRPGAGAAQSIIETANGYTRGLCLLDDGRIAVGVQNEVWLFDPAYPAPPQRIRITDDPRESIHSIVPDLSN